MCPWSCDLCSGCHTSNRIRRGFPTALHSQVRDSNTPLLFSILAGPSLVFLKNTPLSPTDVMQLTPSFVLILGILFRITLNTHAIPLTREQTGVVTLPLKRAPMRQGVHPHKVRLLISRYVRSIVIQASSSSKCTMLVVKDALTA